MVVKSLATRRGVDVKKAMWMQQLPSSDVIDVSTAFGIDQKRETGGDL